MSDPEIIVVGAGSAGCAVAGRLAAAGVKVLLLEAGKSNRDIRLHVPALTSTTVQNPDFDWKYVAEPDPTIGGRADVWPGGKRLGGGSSINGMMYCRGHRWDYDHWVELGARGWSYPEVAPYFRRMETNSRGADAYRGDRGPVGVSDSRAHYPIVDAWLQAVVASGVPRTPDHNGAAPAEGADYAQMTQRNGLRSSSTTYLKLPGTKDSLTVTSEAQALRILVEDGRAVGVEYLQGGERKTARAKRGVVVSSGAMNTPRLLMLSGIGPAAHLAEFGIALVHDAPGVGANLQEHVGTHLVDEVNVPTINSEARGFALLKHFVDFVMRRRGILTTSFGNAQAFVRTRPDLPAPNVQISFTAFAFDLDEHGKLALRTAPSVGSTVSICRPQSRGRLTLRSADPLSPPVIRHQLLGVPDDVEQLAEGMEVARGFLRRPEIAQFVVREVRPGEGVTGPALRDYLHLASIPLYHPAGTCRMGDGPEAVVDPDLRVRGVEGLWVADASVMPTLPAGNTNATATMIGDKGADHVLKALRNAPMLAAVA